MIPRFNQKSRSSEKLTDQNQTSQSLGQNQGLLMTASIQESLGSSIIVEGEGEFLSFNGQSIFTGRTQWWLIAFLTKLKRLMSSSEKLLLF